MKKKSFLSGFNAKLALTVVALSGALLTGCYKDNELDQTGPGTITIPAATYTLTGTVVDADGVLIADAAVTVSPSTGFTQNGASFSAAVAPGAVAITVTPKDGSGYKGVTKTVNVIAVAAGQAAVYTETIVLTKDAPAEKVDAKYDLSVITYGASNLTTPLKADEYTATVTDGKGAVVTSLTGLAAGMYNIVVTPKDVAKYNAYSTALNLATVQVEAGTANIPASVYAVLTEKAAEKEYRVLSAFVDVTENTELTNIQITRDGNVLATTTADYIVYLDEKAAGTYKLVVNYKADGVAKQKIRTFTDKELTFALTLVAHVADVEVEDGEVKTEIDEVIAGDDHLFVAKGTKVTLNGANYNGSFNVIRDFSEESDIATLRAYEGRPNDLAFNPGIKISFKDIWEGELGKLVLKYKNADGTWSEDTKAGSVSMNDNKYVMDVKHFSNFKAEVDGKLNNTATVVDSISTETIIEKKNDTDKSVEVDFTYSYLVGMEIANVYDAVRTAGFTNENAIAYLATWINEELAAKGIVNIGFNTLEATQKITVTPWTCLESVVKKQVMSTETFTFTINGKDVVVVAKIANGVKIESKTYYYGHGHGHAHGHGGNLNAGGGIVEAE